MNLRKQYDLIVYIGRFQPFHNAHLKTIHQAERLSDNILVLVGSSRSPRTPKNPWSAEERADMIRDSVGRHFSGLHIRHLRDYTYDDPQWIRRVGEMVDHVAEQVYAEPDRIAIIGHDKDHSSFYLNYFPQWKFIPVDKYPIEGESIDATKIRRLMFEGDYGFIGGVVPMVVYTNIMRFKDTDDYKLLKQEWEFDKEYKRLWSTAPYPPTFVTVDAVVVQSGHVLLVQRGAFPGKGQWAMPGGYIDVNERLVDSVIRELREETRLKVPEKILRSKIVYKETFDDPSRSMRGRVITHAFLIKLSDDEELPRVKGSDDAQDAKWVPLSKFEQMEPEMFEDHMHIVRHMINKL